MLLRFGALLLLLTGVDPDPRAAAFGRKQGLRTQLADGAPYDLARYERKLRQLSATQFLPHDECLALAARWRSAPPPRGAPPPHAGGSDARLGDLLENWNPSRHVLSLPRKPLRPALCRFHWAEPSQRAAALVMLGAEVPFVVAGAPSVHRASARWSWRYLAGQLRGGTRLTEMSKGARFLFWDQGVANALPLAAQLNFSAPTAKMFTTYRAWRRSARIKLERAMAIAGRRERAGGADDEGGGGGADANAAAPQRRAPAAEASFRQSKFATMLLNSKRDPWIEEELPLFRARQQGDGASVAGDGGGDGDDESVLLGTAQESTAAAHRGTHCRLAMPSSASAVHFDAGRNMVAMIAGHRRYVLLRPTQCPKLELLPMGHPSARHSSASWLGSARAVGSKHPLLASAMASELVLSPGELLHIPSFFFHHITSLDVSLQCNSRAGSPQDSRSAETMKNCGF